MSKHSKKNFLVREISTSPTYIKPTPLQSMEWELEAAKTESAGLQLSVSVLTAEKDSLKLKLADKDAETKQLQHQYLAIEQELQESNTIYQASQTEYEERIAFLESEVEHGRKELADRIDFLELQLKENETQLLEAKAALQVKEEALNTREIELNDREKEVERVRDFFAAGNDVHGLVLDLQGRLRRHEKELQTKEEQLMSYRGKLERAEQETLAIKQTLANQPEKNEEPSNTASLEPAPLPRTRTQLAKRPSLPTQRRTIDPVLQPKRWSMPKLEEDRVYDKPLPPLPTYNKLPFSLEWEKPYTIDSGKKMVNGMSVYSPRKNKLYFSSLIQHEILAYTESGQWEILHPCPYSSFGLAVIEDNLTTVGGASRDRIPSAGDTVGLKYTNKLLSYTVTTDTKRSQWVEIYPAMPSKRANAAVVSTSKFLIVAGGDNEQSYLRTVEIMDLNNKQWYVASLIPRALSHPSMVLCETTNIIYLGGIEEKNSRKQTLFNCSVNELVKTGEALTGQEYEEEPFYVSTTKSKPTPTWQEINNTPPIYSTLAIVNNNFMAAGGVDKKGQALNEICYFNVSKSKWECVAHMPIARHGAVVGVNNSTHKMVVIGGFNKTSIISTVDVAKLK